MNNRLKLHLIALTALLFTALAPTNNTSLAQQGATDGEWRSYAGDTGSSKYTALDQIDADNVENLRVAWQWQSVDGRFDLQQLAQEYPNLQVANDVDTVRIANLKATPLMIDGVLYISTPLSQIAAVDAATGATLWTHDPRAYASGIPTMMLGFSNRGLAYWSDGEQGRLIMGTGDAFLIAVDASSGEPVPGFGRDGRVDLIVGIPRARRTPAPINYSITSAPTVCGDVIVVGSAVSDQPYLREAPPGYVRGFDARNGELLWTFHTIPQPGEYGHETWLDGSWQYTGNVNVWTMMSADEELGYVYLPIGNATNDHYGGHRPGNHLFANSLVALDCKTGERVWHFQMVHHDLWDYDPPAAPNLIDITVDGTAIKAVAQVTKHAFTFVFDRQTGEPVWPIEERPVASSDVPGEWTSETQPFPTKPPPYDRQGVTVDDLIDFTPELRAEAIEILARYRSGPMFTPPSLVGPGPDGTQGTIELPGYTGGANWNGAAIDPETGILYVASSTSPVIPLLVVPQEENATLRYARGPMRPPQGPGGLPLFKPPYGRITAIDLNRGEIVWQQANGLAPPRIRDHPRLQGLELPPLGGNRDLLLVTKTLLFSGQQQPNAEGSYLLTARDKTTGDVLAEIPLPGRAIGAPMSYLIDGRQYIAVTVQGDTPQLVALTVEN